MASDRGISNVIEYSFKVEHQIKGTMYLSLMRYLDFNGKSKLTHQLVNSSLIDNRFLTASAWYDVYDYLLLCKKISKEIDLEFSLLVQEIASYSIRHELHALRRQLWSQRDTSAVLQRLPELLLHDTNFMEFAEIVPIDNHHILRFSTPDKLADPTRWLFKGTITAVLQLLGHSMIHFKEIEVKEVEWFHPQYKEIRMEITYQR